MESARRINSQTAIEALIILYADSLKNDRAIEKLRTLFKIRYHHQAVLRVSEKVQASDDDWQPNAKVRRGDQYN